MKKWLIRIATIITLVIGIYLVVMYKLGDRIINEVIDQQLAQLEQLEQQIQQEQNNPNIIQSEAPTIQNETPVILNEDSVILSEAPVILSEALVILSEAKNPNTPLNNSNASQNQNPDTTENTTQVPKNETSNPTEITREKLENIKGNIAAGDKVAIANFVFKKLTQDDIKEITAMIAGGLTSDEKKRAKQIAYSRFSDSEIKTIIQLYNKYME